MVTLPSAPLRGACGRSSRPWLAFTHTSSVASPSGVRRAWKEISVATDSPRPTPITTTGLPFTVRLDSEGAVKLRIAGWQATAGPARKREVGPSTP